MTPGGPETPPEPSLPHRTESGRPPLRAWKHTRAVVIAAIGGVVILAVWGSLRFYGLREGWVSRITVGATKFRSYDRHTNLADVEIAPVGDLILYGTNGQQTPTKGFVLEPNEDGWIFAFDQSGAGLPMTSAKGGGWDRWNSQPPACTPLANTRYIRLAFVPSPVEGPDAERRARDLVRSAVRRPLSWAHVCGLVEILGQLDEVRDPAVLGWLAWVAGPGANELGVKSGMGRAGPQGSPWQVEKLRAEAAAIAYVGSGFDGRQEKLIRQLLQGDARLAAYTLGKVLAFCWQSGRAVPEGFKRLSRASAAKWDDWALEQILSEEVLALAFGRRDPSVSEAESLRQRESRWLDLVEMLPPKHYWLVDHFKPQAPSDRVIAALRKQVECLRTAPRADADGFIELLEYFEQHDPDLFLDELAAVEKAGTHRWVTQSFLGQAYQRRDTDKLRQMLQRGIKAGPELLIAAAEQGDLETLKLLLPHVADVNARGSGQQTVLHAAAAQAGPNALPMVKLLLEDGCDPNLLDYHKHTPVDLARQSGDVEVVKLLRAQGAKTGRQLRAAAIVEQIPQMNEPQLYAAVWQMRELGTDANDAAPTLIELIKKKTSPRVYESAIDTVVVIAPDNEALIPVLREGLKDKNLEIRVTAATKIWELEGDGEAAAIAAIRALRLVAKAEEPSNSSWRAAWRAVDLLAEIGPPAHEGAPLIAVVVSRGMVSDAAEKVFAELNLERLVDCLTHEDRRVRRGAWKAFCSARRHDSKEDWPTALLKKLAEEADEEPRRWATNKLPEIGHEP